MTADPQVALTVSEVGAQYQVNIASAVSRMVPYVLAIIAIFLVIKLTQRWMLKASRGHWHVTDHQGKEYDVFYSTKKSEYQIDWKENDY
jgi:hypothetical protein